MTNAEKYEEVFGLPPLTHNCITEKPCPDCPIYNKRTNQCLLTDKMTWWNKEYKGGAE